MVFRDLHLFKINWKFQLWEGIGISSYLLINFWFTRIQANKAAILALTMNRVGDMMLSLAFFALFWLFGNVDYASVFSLAPFMNETAITIIGILLLFAAMGKSAQIGLHSWLPGSMEGYKNEIKWSSLVILFLLFIYLVNKESFYSSLEIGNFYCLGLATVSPIINSIPKDKLYIITGNMLGDGSIQISKNRKGLYTGKAKYGMTLDAYSINYLNHLYDTVYGEYCSSAPYAYPNIKLPQHVGKTITQYSFQTKSHPLFSDLHSLWYKWNENDNKYQKIVPENIKYMFSPISLAYWIMDDGYFDSYGRAQTIILCTESFTKSECVLLQSILSDLNIKSTLKIRSKENDRYRIRISKTSMNLLQKLVTPYMHKDFLYKLGLK